MNRCDSRHSAANRVQARIQRNTVGRKDIRHLGLGPRPRGGACSVSPKLEYIAHSVKFSRLSSSHYYYTPLLQKNPSQQRRRKSPNAFPLHLLQPSLLFRRSRPSVFSPELRARSQPSRRRHRGSSQSRPCRNGHLLCLQEDLPVSHRLLFPVMTVLLNLALTAVCLIK
jgi:hypothetical protein